MADQRRVLVVDDSLLICRQIELAFKEDAISIYQAHTGTEALETIERVKPDLILLDVVLPDMEGYELMGRIRDREHVAVIFITSRDKDEDVVRGFSLGACDYIKKPFQSGEMRSRVMAHLEAKKRRDELESMNESIRMNMEKLNSIVYRDELTGLYNRRYVVEQLKGRADDPNYRAILVLIDIDDFKRVNDSYGHEAGDVALICISSMMEEICRGYTVSRWGGEEFLIVLSDMDMTAAKEICERLRREVAEFPFVQREITFFCTITLGLTEYRSGEGLKENIARADKALYEGKHNGKNQTLCYGDGA